MEQKINWIGNNKEIFSFKKKKDKKNKIDNWMNPKSKSSSGLGLFNLNNNKPKKTIKLYDLNNNKLKSPKSIELFNFNNINNNKPKHPKSIGLFNFNKSKNTIKPYKNNIHKNILNLNYKNIKSPNKISLMKKRDSTILSSQESLYGKKNLKLYGDKDMDGSPNKWDCSPGDVSKDGFFSNILSKVTKGKYGQSDEDYEEEKRRKEDDELIKERIVKPYAPLGEKELAKQAYEKGKTDLAFEYDSDTAVDLAQEEIKKTVDEYEKDKQETEKRKLIKKEKEEAKTLAKERKEKLSEMGEIVDGKIKLKKMKQFGYDVDYEQMKKESNKIKKEKEYLDKIDKFESTALRTEEEYVKDKTDMMKRKYIPKIISGTQYNYKTGKRETTGILPGLSALAGTMGKTLVTDVAPALKYNILNPEAYTDTGAWSKASKTAGYKFRKPIAGALSESLPKGFLTKDVEKLAKSAQSYPGSGSKKKKDSKDKGRPGRPKGSFKEDQYIPGVGLVDVYTWRKYARKQRSIARLAGAGARSPITTDASEYQYTQQPEIYEQQQIQPQPQQQTPMSSSRYMDIERQIQELKRMQQLNPYQQVQLQEQRSDNILTAPNFMKGELTNVGGQNSFTYTSPDANILNAPNISMGQMRNVNETGDIPAVRLSAKPITNPRGDQYVEIDLVSGQPILKTRKSERWATGEAY